MKTILITGCAGLFGSNFSRHLIESGYMVVGVDNFFGGYRDFLPNHLNFKFYQKNLECDDISIIFEENNIDVVFHFAAYAAEGLSPFIRKFNYMNNVISSVSIINQCINRDIKIVFTSSMAVYGNLEAPFTENMIPAPIDPYGIAKFSVEQDLKSAHEQFGLRFNIVRPHNVLGIYQNIWDRYRNVIGIFIRRTLNNEPMLIYGDGNQTRAFSDVLYYMEPLEKLIYSFDGEVYNIGADKHFTINEIANIVSEVAVEFGYSPTIEYSEPRHEVKHAYCDHSKAIDDLEFIDNTNVRSLISEMFDWAKNQPIREVRTMNYEVNKDLYKYWM